MNVQAIFTWQEAVPVVIFLFIVGLLANWYQRTQLDSRPYRVFFLPSLGVKVVGAVAFILIHLVGEVGDDTFNYYRAISLVWEQIRENPQDFWRYFIAAPGDSIFPNDFSFSLPASVVITKIGTLFSILSGNSFWVITLSFGFLSFLGSWALFVNLVRIRPDLIPWLAVIVFFLPSVVFWGSGLMKDPITLGLFCWLSYAVINLLILHRKVVRSILIILICTYLISRIRIYVVLAFLPAVSIMIGQLTWERLDHVWKKIAFVGALLVLAVVAEFLTDGLTESVANYHRWHTGEVISKKPGSVYILEPFLPGWSGALKAFFPALVVTLFRPFPWEWSSLWVVWPGLESLSLLILTVAALVVIARKGLKKLIHNIRSQPLIGYFSLFSILYAFPMGLFSYNFGTLSRYRIAVIPFYLIGLLFLVRSNPNNRKPAESDEPSPKTGDSHAEP